MSRPLVILVVLAATSLFAVLASAAPASATAVPVPVLTQVAAQKVAERVAPKLVMIGPLKVHGIATSPPFPGAPLEEFTTTSAQAVASNINPCTQSLAQSPSDSFGCDVTYSFSSTMESPGGPPESRFSQTCHRLVISKVAKGTPHDPPWNPLLPDTLMGSNQFFTYTYTVLGTSYVNEPHPPVTRYDMSVRFGKHWQLNIRSFTEYGGAGAPCSPTFAFGKTKLNKHKGTAEIKLKLPGPGTIQMRGKGVKAASKAVSAAGVATLNVIPTGGAKKKLNKTGKATVKLKTTYTPSSGTPDTQSKSITLIKQRRKFF